MRLVLGVAYSNIKYSSYKKEKEKYNMLLKVILIITTPAVVLLILGLIGI